MSHEHGMASATMADYLREIRVFCRCGFMTAFPVRPCPPEGSPYLSLPAAHGFGRLCTGCGQPIARCRGRADGGRTA